MKYFARIFCLTIALIVVTACGTRRSGVGGAGSFEDVIVFDYKENYPNSELTLADIADVEYIPIGKSDDFLISGRSNSHGMNTYVSDEFILTNDNNQIFMFDRQGNPIRKIGMVGRGPNEYTNIHHFVGVDEALGELYVNDGSERVQVFGLDGIFRRTIDTETNSFLSGMQLLGDKEILCFDNKKSCIYTVSRQDGRKLRDMPVTLPLERKIDREGRMAYPTILPNEGGLTLFELRTDTIWHFSADGTLRPVMVDVTRYPSPDELYGPDNAQFLPLIENDKYIIGSILCSKWITPDVKERQYIYDKGQKQWFTLGESTDWSGFELISDNINFPRFVKTQTPGYIAWFLQPVHLLENRDKWQSEELEKILTRGIAEDDNPILMLVKFN
jgi:hypothetical protein